MENKRFLQRTLIIVPRRNAFVKSAVSDLHRNLKRGMGLSDTALSLALSHEAVPESLMERAG